MSDDFFVLISQIVRPVPSFLHNLSNKVQKNSSLNTSGITSFLQKTTPVRPTIKVNNVLHIYGFFSLGKISHKCSSDIGNFHNTNVDPFSVSWGVII